MEAFIKKHGVTKCPSVGSPELTKLEIERATKKPDNSSWGWGAGPQKQKGPNLAQYPTSRKQKGNRH